MENGLTSARRKAIRRKSGKRRLAEASLYRLSRVYAVSSKDGKTIYFLRTLRQPRRFGKLQRKEVRKWMLLLQPVSRRQRRNLLRPADGASIVIPGLVDWPVKNSPGAREAY